MQDDAPSHRLLSVVGARWCTCSHDSVCGGCNYGAPAHGLVYVVGARWCTGTQVSVCGGCKMMHLRTVYCLWWVQGGAPVHMIVSVVGVTMVHLHTG